MNRTRKFDWDEAARLRGGPPRMSYAKVAEALGVSETAVMRALKPELRRRMDEYATARVRGKGTCLDCGTPITRAVGARPAKRCRDCSALARAVTVRETTLQCVTCREWMPDESFPRSASANKARRGRHKQCRACATIARREYRNRNKVPCAGGCGRLVMALNEQQASSKCRGYTSTGMCRSCANLTYQARKRAAA